jgi:hypothetical protein
MGIEQVIMVLDSWRIYLSDRDFVAEFLNPEVLAKIGNGDRLSNFLVVLRNADRLDLVDRVYPSGMNLHFYSCAA